MVRMFGFNLSGTGYDTCTSEPCYFCLDQQKYTGQISLSSENSKVQLIL